MLHRIIRLRARPAFLINVDLKFILAPARFTSSLGDAKFLQVARRTVPPSSAPRFATPLDSELKPTLLDYSDNRFHQDPRSGLYVL